MNISKIEALAIIRATQYLFMLDEIKNNGTSERDARLPLDENELQHLEDVCIKMVEEGIL